MAKATICAVIVVPTLAPRMTPIDWLSVSNPAEMKPTTSTVVTEDDWMTAVMRAPAIAAVKRFLVSRASSFFMLLPATVLRDSVRRRMP